MLGLLLGVFHSSEHEPFDETFFLDLNLVSNWEEKLFV